SRSTVRALAVVPGAFNDYDVTLVRMRVRPAHHAGRKSIDDQIKPGLRRIAFENRRLHAKLVPFCGRPRQLVEILAKKWPARKTSEFRLPIARGRCLRGGTGACAALLLCGPRRQNHQAETQNNRRDTGGG